MILENSNGDVQVMDSGAHISDDGLYRYSLWRQWETGKPYALFMGLNPSTADAKKNDHTITKEINFARQRGCGGLMKVNLYAWRAKDRKEILSVADPIGPMNDGLLYHFFNDAVRLEYPIYCAWGNADDDKVVKRVEQVKGILRMCNAKPLAFGFTKSGQPLHPLTLPYKTEPKPWTI